MSAAISVLAPQLASFLPRLYTVLVITDPGMRKRGREAYELYRKHVAVDVVIAGRVVVHGENLRPWEGLSAISQESWVKMANGLEYMTASSNPVRLRGKMTLGDLWSIRNKQRS